jgi:AcrR family transcriptional regulator
VVVGRPRGVEDAVILRATAEVVGRVGPAGLTLAAVAREVGVVPGTLVQRFGSKRGLLLALTEHSAKNADALPARVRAEHDSPLAALTALIMESMGPMATPETYANHLAFLCIDLTDPQFHQHALTIHQAQRRAIEELLADAVSTGALRAGTDIAALAGSVQAMAAGAGLTWALDRQDTLAQRLEQEIGTVLSPYVQHHDDPALEE